MSTNNKGETRWVKVGGVAVSVLVVGAISYAAQVPNAFVPNTVASASQRNLNFTYLGERAWELAAGGGLHHPGNIGIGNNSRAKSWTSQGTCACRAMSSPAVISEAAR